MFSRNSINFQIIIHYMSISFYLTVKPQISSTKKEKKKKLNHLKIKTIIKSS